MSLFGSDAPDIKWYESLDPLQVGLRNRLIGGISQTMKTPWEMPDYVPGASPLQQMGMAAAQQRIEQGLPGPLSTAIQDLATGRPSYVYDPASSEQFYSEALHAPAMREFQQDILPSIAAQYGAAGLSRGGDFQGALARAASDFGTNLAAQRANLIRSDVLDARQAAESAMGRMPTGLQLAGRELALPVELGMGVGGVQRGIESQLGLQGLQQDIASQWWGNPALGFLPTVLNPTRMPVVSQGRQTGQAILGGALSGAATGAQFGPWGALAGAGLGGLGGGLLG